MKIPGNRAREFEVSRSVFERRRLILKLNLKKLMTPIIVITRHTIGFFFDEIIFSHFKKYALHFYSIHVKEIWFCPLCNNEIKAKNRFPNVGQGLKVATLNKYLYPK